MLKIRLLGIATLFLIATVNAMETPNDDNNNNNNNALALRASKNQFSMPNMSTVLTQGSHLGSQFNRPRSSSTTQNDPINRRSTIKQIFKQKEVYIGDDALEYLVQKTKKDNVPTVNAFITFMAEELFATGEIQATQEFCRYACEKKFQTEVVVNSVKKELTETKIHVQATNSRLSSLEEKIEENRKIAAQEHDELKKAIAQLIFTVSQPPIKDEPQPGRTPIINKTKQSSIGSKLLIVGTLGLAGYSAFKMNELQNNNNELGEKIYKVALENLELKNKLLELAAAATPKAAEAIATSIWSGYCTIL